MKIALCLALMVGAALGQDITVVIFISTVCPVSNSYNLRMKELYRDFAPKGVKFEFLNANQNESQMDMEDHARSVGFPFPVAKDANNAMADRLGAEYTPESFVIDREGVVRYHAGGTFYIVVGLAYASAGSWTVTVTGPGRASGVGPAPHCNEG